MKKKLLVFAVVSMFTLSVTACSGKSPDKGADSTGQTVTASSEIPDEKPNAEDPSKSTAQEAASSQESIDNTSEGSLTGIVEENKGFMITLIANEEESAYVFNLDETQSETYKNIKTGDQVTISYTNGLPTPDNLETVVTDIKVIE